MLSTSKSYIGRETERQRDRKTERKKEKKKKRKKEKKKKRKKEKKKKRKKEKKTGKQKERQTDRKTDNKKTDRQEVFLLRSCADITERLCRLIIRPCCRWRQLHRNREIKKTERQKTEKQKHKRGFSYFGVVQISPLSFADWSLADAVDVVNFKELYWQRDRETERQKDRKTKRKKEKKTERQANKKKDRQTEKQTTKRQIDKRFSYFGVVQVSPSGFADWSLADAVDDVNFMETTLLKLTSRFISVEHRIGFRGSSESFRNWRLRPATVFFSGLGQ